jgi:hypothetical protein
MTTDDRRESPTEEEFEDFVEALLQVDPTGLSGKHHRPDEAPTPPYEAMSPEELQREAVRINDELSRRGINDGAITAWWNEPRSELGGASATAVWLAGGRWAEVWGLLA